MTISRVIKLYIFFAVLFVVQLAATYFLIRTISLQETLRTIHEVEARVKHDLRFQDGKWDTSLYNSDPFTAYPNSSSSYPLYIVTSDGFVIERSKPISGVLDTSDFKHLMQFQTPQFLSTVTNEHWRLLSKPVIREGKTYGVIIVALYNPSETALAQTDKSLAENIEKIDAVLDIKDNTLSAEKVDVRNIQYLVSFEIVDSFNKVLVNDGRIPTFIDPSYVSEELHTRNPQIVTDTTTKETYLISSEAISAEDGSPVAIVVAGRSVQPLVNTLRTYLSIASILSLLCPLPLAMLANSFLQKTTRKELSTLRESEQQERIPHSITFDKKQSAVYVDEQKIEIAYASNQYYICKALLTSPKKRWEQDELIHLMGYEPSPDRFRKAYDAALAINKKVGLKLIMYQDKTYFINPRFALLIRV